jgi:hypothetical protein
MNNLIIYNAVKDKMKTGDGVGFVNTGFISKAIMWKTHKDVAPNNPIQLSHFGGIIRAGKYEGKEERRFTIEAMNEGFYPDILSHVIKDYKGHIYWYPLQDEWDEHRDHLGAEILSMIGIGYDWLSIGKQLVGKVSADARKMFCSEAWQIGYQNVAQHLCNDQKGKALTPTGMWKLGVFKQPVKLI